MKKSLRGVLRRANADCIRRGSSVRKDALGLNADGSDPDAGADKRDWPENREVGLQTRNTRTFGIARAGSASVRGDVSLLAY